MSRVVCELPYIIGAGVRSVQACLDAVAFIFDITIVTVKGEINFGKHAGNIKPFGVANTTAVLGVQVRTDFLQTSLVIVVIIHTRLITIVADMERSSDGTDGKQGDDKCGIEMHCGYSDNDWCSK